VIKNVPTSNIVVAKIILVVLLVAATIFVFQLFPTIGMRFVLVEIIALLLYGILSMKNGNDSHDDDHDNPNSFRIEF
jgi:hypothetical protein